MKNTFLNAKNEHWFTWNIPSRLGCVYFYCETHFVFLLIDHSTQKRNQRMLLALSPYLVEYQTYVTMESNWYLQKLSTGLKLID